MYPPAAGQDSAHQRRPCFPKLEVTGMPTAEGWIRGSGRVRTAADGITVKTNSSRPHGTTGTSLRNAAPEVRRKHHAEEAPFTRFGNRQK